MIDAMFCHGAFLGSSQAEPDIIAPDHKLQGVNYSANRSS